MYKIIIWGIGCVYNQYINNIRLQELMGKLTVQAVTSNEKNISTVDGYRFVSKDKICNVEYDYCVAAVKDFQSVLKEAPFLGIETQKCIPIKVFSIPFFDLAKYIKIKNDRISIISRNCWAGLCYNYLGLQLNSPFINMFFNDGDFNRLMKKFDYYLSVPLEFERMDFDNHLKREYPVGRLDDICLYFNHYLHYADAKECYDRRKRRINKEKMIFVSSTVRKNVETEFDGIPYARKVMFVPYDSDLKSSIKIDYTETESHNGITIGMKSNSVANGQNPLFDILSFLGGEENFLRIRGGQRVD